MTNFFEEENNRAVLVQLYEANLKGESFRYFDVFDYVEIIEYYLAYMQDSKAQQAINEGLNQHKDAVLIQYKQVELFIAKGMHRKAFSLVEELGQNNDDDEYYFWRGTVFTALGKFEEADSSFQQAIIRETDSLENLCFRIGIAFQQVYKFQFALRYHHKLYEINPSDLENIFEVAYCYEQLERFDNSIKFYNKYLDADPYSYKVWYNLGIIYNHLRRYDEAVEAYDYTLAIRPKHSKAFFNKGNALFYLQKYREAMTCYFTYLNYEDDHSFTNTYIGECYEKLGEYENAILHYEKAIEIDEKLSDAWFGLGMVAKLQGKIGEAIQYMERAAKVDETYAECYAELGELYSLVGEDTLAINAYRYAIIAEPEVWQYHLELAKFYHKRNNIVQARKILEAVKKDFKGEAELFYYLSLFCLLQEEKENAKRYLKKARTIDNAQFDTLVNYCKRNETLVSKGQIDELLKLH